MEPSISKAQKFSVPLVGKYKPKLTIIQIGSGSSNELNSTSLLFYILLHIRKNKILEKKERLQNVCKLP